MRASASASVPADPERQGCACIELLVAPVLASESSRGAERGRGKREGVKKRVRNRERERERERERMRENINHLQWKHNEALGLKMEN